MHCLTVAPNVLMMFLIICVQRGIAINMYVKQGNVSVLVEAVKSNVIEIT